MPILTAAVDVGEHRVELSGTNSAGTGGSRSRRAFLRRQRRDHRTPKVPSVAKVLRSAWMPAPPHGSDPAMVRTFGSGHRLSVRSRRAFSIRLRSSPAGGRGIGRRHDRRDHRDAIRARPHRLGHIAGVDAADRDQRQRAQLAHRTKSGGPDWFAGIGFGRRGGEHAVGDIVDVFRANGERLLDPIDRVAENPLPGPAARVRPRLADRSGRRGCRRRRRRARCRPGR